MSCTSCNASKTKCSFAKPQCLRCEIKGLNCIYSKPKARTIPAQSIPEQIPESNNVRELNFQLNPSPGRMEGWIGAWPDGDIPLGMDSSALDFEQGQLIPFDTLIHGPEKWRNTASQPDVILSVGDAGAWSQPLEPSSPQSTSSSVEDIISLSRSTTTLIHLRHGNPASKYAASLISNILSAFPTMMLRRQTFPPFIHPHWHSSSLPEKLAVCMNIAQLFAARTPETRPFLWRTIDASSNDFETRHVVQLFVLPLTPLLIDIAYGFVCIRDSNCHTVDHDLHYHGNRRSRCRYPQAWRKIDSNFCGMLPATMRRNLTGLTSIRWFPCGS